MDSNGNYIWAKSFGSTGTNLDIGNSLKLDLAGNIYTTGWFSGTGDFDPGAGVFNLTSTESFASGGSPDVFIHKLNSEGNFLWAKSFGGNAAD